MSVHVFVDEVRRRDYLMCAAVVPAGDLAAARRTMRALRPGNRRRLHMHDEGVANRRRILAEFVRRAPVSQAHVWIAEVGGRSERSVRDQCFRSLVPHAVALGAHRLVVESCAQDQRDRKIIGDVLAQGGSPGALRFDVIPAVADEMLWAADLIAWAYGAGGEYRRAIRTLVTAHHVP